MLHRARLKMRSFWRRRQLDRDITEELAFHLEMLAREGSQAPSRFGNRTAIQEACRELWTLGSIEIWWQDFVYAWRVLRKNRAFTAVTITTLALGIGANTAIFSVINGVILRSLPYPDSGRLAMLWATSYKEPYTSIPNYQDWKSQSSAFQHLTFYNRWPVTLFDRSDRRAPEDAVLYDVAPNFFTTMGTAPRIGRPFTDAEAERGERVVVVSEPFWRSYLGESADVSDQTVDLDGADYRVVGVMPGSFRFPSKDAQIWRPAAASQWWADYSPLRRRVSAVVIGRLRQGVTFEQARTEMQTIAGRLELQYPDTNRGSSITIAPLDSQLLGKTVPALLMVLFGAVLLVLLIACVNVAHLLMARGERRVREFALRTALGAGRLRLIRQVLAESVLLALGGACLGLPLAVWGVDALVAIGPRDIPRLDEVRVDGSTLLFTMAIALLTGILFGVVPAFKAARQDSGVGLATGLRSGWMGPGWRKHRGVLIVAEVSLATVLLTGAGLLVRSFLAVLGVDPGVRSRNVITMEWRLEQDEDFLERTIARIRAVPGVDAAGAINDIFFPNPDGPKGGDTLEVVEGHAQEARDQWKPLYVTPTTGNVFQALGIRLLKGRYFLETDTAKAPLAVIINETMAHRFWPGEDPVGKRFKGYPGSKDWVTVIGLVQDVRNLGLERQAASQMFAAPRQFKKPGHILVVRGTLPPTQLAANVKAVVQSMDRRAVLGKVATLDQLLDEQTSRRRFQSYLLSLFSVLALVLSGVGIYGLLHYSVAQRTNEIGIRMALGARPRDVIRMVAGEGLALMLFGVGLGSLAALALTRAISSLLFGVKPADPVTFAAAALLLAAVAMIASYVPARRATRVDPTKALRSE
ncbi:MAG TPA: ABC transporter permease [Bryobacteraceae bacterium]|nr:ABC transporter permease [Bryobacteraceae bacterium]